MGYEQLEEDIKNYPQAKFNEIMTLYNTFDILNQFCIIVGKYTQEMLDAMIDRVVQVYWCEDIENYVTIIKVSNTGEDELN